MDFRHPASTAGRRTLTAILAGMALFLCQPRPVCAAEVFDERGFQPNRDYFNQLPFEHIDPITGNLILTVTDLILPGNAGFDLRVQRTYNSKIYLDYMAGTNLAEDSWAGVGWTLHFGRLWNPDAVGGAPVVEMPDGSRHPMYHALSGNLWVSRDYWTLDTNAAPQKILRLTDGRVYKFGTRRDTINGKTVAYVDEISDPFGNKITLTYNNTPSAPRDAISTIVQDLGSSQSRTVSFGITTDALRRLSTMAYTAGSKTYTWTYTQTHPNGLDFEKSLLTSVQPPIGAAWTYGYSDTSPNPTWELLKVTTPYGGTITYTYEEFTTYLGNPTNPLRFHGVKTRLTGGRDVPAGTRTFEYAQGSPDRNQTIIKISGCGPTEHKTTMTFMGIGQQTVSPVDHVWQIGLLKKKTVEEGTTILQTEDYTWRTPLLVDSISQDNETVGNRTDDDIYVPLLAQKKVTRNERVYTTDYTYRSGAGLFNDYGKPSNIAETGDLARTTTRIFDYSFTAPLYLKDRIATETVTDGSQNFTKSFSYVDANGFKDSETIFGRKTDYTPSGSPTRGNVGSAKDASGHETTYTYSWGVLKDVTPPVTGTSITRTINLEGTVASETRGGSTTAFEYDDRFRIKTVTPPAVTPASNPTTTTYFEPASGDPYVKVARGSAYVQTNLDGFGRPTGTQNAVSVKTDITYDACDRRVYESFPFGTSGPGSTNLGVTTTYDGLGRPLTRTNNDTTTATYTYSNNATEGAINIAIKNERDKNSHQRIKAFGDPHETRLASVVDAAGKTWRYTYNVMGSLLTITPPLGAGRQWTYFGAAPLELPFQGLLKSETHPESGTTQYTYYADGMLKTREDPAFGITTYTNDGNHRLTFIDRPTAYDPHDVHFEYDGRDNRTRAYNGLVDSGFGYDNASRLTSRTDTFHNRTYTTIYTPDPNDNVQRIDYASPSTLSVAYAYDNGNRVAAAWRNGGSCPPQPAPLGSACFARSFSYHPSGAPLSFEAGNGITHSFTYDADRYWLTDVNQGTVLNLGYRSFDGVGNVGSITDSRTGFNQTLGYDDIDRLTDDDGPWGDGVFTYDELGNRKSKKIGADTTNYAYNTGSSGNGQLNVATGAEADSFGHDSNGNLISQTSQPGRTYTYTPDNLVATATVGAAASVYEYDADGLRTFRQSDGRSHHYVHGPGGQILAEYVEICPGTVQVARNYIYAGSRMIASDRPTTGSISVVLDAPLPYQENNANCPPNTSCPATLTARLLLNGLPSLPCAVTVSYATGAAGDTATPGVDYTPTSGSINFAAGSLNNATRPVPVLVYNDTLDEDNETFTVTLSGDAVGNPASRVVTIADDDPPPVISINNCSVTEGTGGTTVCGFNVTLNTASGKTVTVNAATANQTATQPGDYLAKAEVVTFPPGVTSQPFAVTVNGDNVDEPTQTFVVNLTNPTNGTIGAQPGVGTIVDDDQPPNLSISSIKVTDRNPATVGTVSVSLSNYSELPISVNYATVAGSATPGLDYVPVAGPLSFAPGQVPVAGETRKFVGIPIIQDALEEGAETFQVQLSGAVNANLPAGPATETIVERSALPLACAPPLEPQNDGSGIPDASGVPDLVLSEIAPLNHIELYNSTSTPIVLASAQHQLVSEPVVVAVSTLASSAVVPAHGYAKLQWPPQFTDSNTGGEIVLFKNSALINQNLLDFTCWGSNPHGTRKPQAEMAGKWVAASPCAPPLTIDAISRRVRTQGIVAGDYDTVSSSSPMNCVGTFAVTTTVDGEDGTCDAAHCSLREAITAANAAPGPDVVRLPKGTYKLTRAGNDEDANHFGDLDVLGDLRLAGQGAVSTVVDAASGILEQGDRGLDIAPGVSALVSGVTLKNGFPQARKNNEGGTVRNRGTLILRDAALTGGAAPVGGGLYSSGPSATLSGVTVSGNASTWDGGGIEAFCNNCSLTIVDSTISGNNAFNRGGGLFVDGGVVAQVINSTISANVSDGDSNAAGSGGGVYGGAATVRFRNSIVAGNLDNSGLAPDCQAPTITSEQYNLIGNGTGCSFPQGTGDQIGVSALLDPLANNRGPTQTHALQAVSPAIDSANPGAPGSGGFTCETRDQRGYIRPRDGETPPAPPAVCDKGAFELCVPVYNDMSTNFAYPFARDLTCRGITSGCGNGNFCPGSPLSRQEMAVFLIASMGEQPSGVAHNLYFSDVAADNPFAGFINRIKELGISGGCGGTNFCPSTPPMTREAAAVWIIVALEEKASGVPINQYFGDLTNPVTAGFVNRLYELGIAGGCGAGTFCPGANLTRDTMAVWMWAAFFSY